MITPPSGKEERVTYGDEEEAREMYRAMALPTVLVRATGGTGSGVILGDGSLVLTAAHVVSHVETETDKNGMPISKNVVEDAVVFKNEGIGLPFVTGLQVVKIDFDLDLAVLRLARVYPYGKAVLAKQDPYLYQKCWASGHPHGVTDATITEGRIQDLWDEGFLRHSAASTFGNSGCPIFVRENGRYVMLSIHQRGYVEYGVAVNHMGLSSLPDKTREFMEGVE